MSQLGVILGTAAYMAPEQAKGTGWVRPTPQPGLVRKFELASEGLQQSLGIAPVIAPDGSSVAYVANGRLIIRQLDQLAAVYDRGSIHLGGLHT